VLLLHPRALARPRAELIRKTKNHAFVSLFFIWQILGASMFDMAFGGMNMFVRGDAESKYAHASRCARRGVCVQRAPHAPQRLLSTLS
jgi:hypothetical protein